MSTLAERIGGLVADFEKSSKKSKGQVIADLAKHCAIKEPSIYNWLDGSTKRLQGMNLINAAAFFNVNPVWLDSGRGPKTLLVLNEPAPQYASGVSENDFVLIEELANDLGAGNGGSLKEYDEVDGHRAYRRDWIEKNGFNPSKLKLLQVKGDSMVPYLFDGNKVLINTADRRIIDGEHYAIRVGDYCKVKRLFTQGDGKIRVESYNAPTEFITRNDDAEVLGIVVDRNGTSRGR